MWLCRGHVPGRAVAVGRTMRTDDRIALAVPCRVGAGGAVALVKVLLQVEGGDSADAKHRLADRLARARLCDEAARGDLLALRRLLLVRLLTARAVKRRCAPVAGSAASVASADVPLMKRVCIPMMRPRTGRMAHQTRKSCLLTGKRAVKQASLLHGAGRARGLRAPRALPQDDDEHGAEPAHQLRDQVELLRRDGLDLVHLVRQERGQLRRRVGLRTAKRRQSKAPRKARAVGSEARLASTSKKPMSWRSSAPEEQCVLSQPRGSRESVFVDPASRRSSAPKPRWRSLAVSEAPASPLK